jgi:hypothetical protein
MYCAVAITVPSVVSALVSVSSGQGFAATDFANPKIDSNVPVATYLLRRYGSRKPTRVCDRAARNTQSITRAWLAHSEAVRVAEL